MRVAGRGEQALSEMRVGMLFTYTRMCAHIHNTHRNTRDAEVGVHNASFLARTPRCHAARRHLVARHTAPGLGVWDARRGVAEEARSSGDEAGREEACEASRTDGVLRCVAMGDVTHVVKVGARQGFEPAPNLPRVQSVMYACVRKGGCMCGRARGMYFPHVRTLHAEERTSETERGACARACEQACPLSKSRLRAYTDQEEVSV